MSIPYIHHGLWGVFNMIAPPKKIEEWDTWKHGVEVWSKYSKEV